MTYICKSCGTEVNDRHVRKKTPGVCRPCFIKNKKTRERSYKCQHCQKRFSRVTWPENSAPKFCSKDCFFESQRAKNRETIYKCEGCGQSFARRFRAYRVPRFCSYECSVKARVEDPNSFFRRRQEPGQEFPCKRCGKMFIVKTTRRNKQNYCSRACAKQAPCPICGKTIASQNIVFCSRRCSVLGEYLAGKCDYRIRGFMVTVRRKGKVCCEKCADENLYHLTVHHRDENRGNGTDENLETLCANCHFEIHWADKPARVRRMDRVLAMLKQLSTP